VLFAWSAGLIEGITSFGEDLLSRHASTMPDDGRIVMIDINDHALKWVHAWPWPRRIHAELVRTLHELGATAIVLDIVFAEPSSPRRAEASSAAPWFDRPSEHAFGGADSPEVIRDDEELAAAMREVGNVYTAAYFDPQPDREPPTGLLGQAVEALVNNFGLDAGALAERLGEHSIDERTFVEAKARTARRLATDALNRDVSLTLESFLIGVPGVGRAGHRSRDRRAGRCSINTRAYSRRCAATCTPRAPSHRRSRPSPGRRVRWVWRRISPPGPRQRSATCRCWWRPAETPLPHRWASMRPATWSARISSRRAGRADASRSPPPEVRCTCRSTSGG
jgi:hypothetical protein